ncbi:chemotaxis protein [Candidatus Magnetomonas plexicatena]|uniref:chemotaxis protein n=1 Tax=Candidatus Magnetomonas plexicatena TaxID=2552947 RepID=UPI001101CB25|nr:chemotaxis protein CheV [Nitrospirales bacterium LBB_01]
MTNIIDQIKSEILLETGTNELEILEFYIDEESRLGQESRSFFGMNVAKVMQVIENPNLKPRDYAQNPCFLGTIPLRDHIVPIIDLSIWLGVQRTADSGIIIITEFSKSVQGFLVSGVTEITRFQWKEVVPPGRFISHLGSKAIVGMVYAKDHFIQLLDLEHIISDLDPHSSLDSWKTTVRAQTQYRALIVDDSETIREIIRRNMEAANFKTKLLDNGQEALEYLKGLGKKGAAEGKDIIEYVDVVISDIEMPLLDGYTLTKNIKQDPYLQKIPVILYSSLITTELRHKGESVGADDQVSKPDLNEMAARAIKLIEERLALV